MDLNKIVDRVEKLLRLAAPDSGATQPERESAAVEAVRLICEHKLKVVTEIERAAQPAARDGRRAPPRSPCTTVWVRWPANRHFSCANCGDLISRGDVVWMRVRDGEVECLHNYRPCQPSGYAAR